MYLSGLWFEKISKNGHNLYIFCRYKDDPTNIDEVELERSFGFKIADLRNKKIADAAKKEIDTKHGNSTTFWKGTFYNKTDSEKKELEKGLENTGAFV